MRPFRRVCVMYYNVFVMARNVHSDKQATLSQIRDIPQLLRRPVVIIKGLRSTVTGGPLAGRGWRILAVIWFRGVGEGRGDRFGV